MLEREGSSSWKDWGRRSGTGSVPVRVGFEISTRFDDILHLPLLRGGNVGVLEIVLGGGGGAR